MRLWIIEFHIRIILASAVPLYYRHYTPGHEQFITTSIYRRVQLFLRERWARHFVDVLRELRAELNFALIVPPCGIMREHFHVLPRPPGG